MGDFASDDVPGAIFQVVHGFGLFLPDFSRIMKRERVKVPGVPRKSTNSTRARMRACAHTHVRLCRFPGTRGTFRSNPRSEAKSGKIVPVLFVVHHLRLSEPLSRPEQVFSGRLSSRRLCGLPGTSAGTYAQNPAYEEKKPPRSECSRGSHEPFLREMVVPICAELGRRAPLR